MIYNAFWTVHISYKPKIDDKWRRNLHIHVLAPTIERVIELVQKQNLEEIKIFSVKFHHNQHLLIYGANESLIVDEQ